MSKNEYLRSFRLSAGAGAVFGLLASAVLLQLVPLRWPAPLFVGGVTVFVSIYSGLSGMGAALISDLLQHWGLQKPQLRALIGFAVVGLVAVALTAVGVHSLGLGSIGTQMQQYTVWGALAGLAFGAVFAVVAYQMEKTQQKLKVLEMQNRHLEELAQREELLREAARNLAVAEERNRMARELHDSISQGMHGIIYSLRSLRSVLEGDPRGQAILSHLEETANGTLKELRHLVMELSPTPLEDHGLSEALRLYCDLFTRRQQVELDLKLEYHGELQPEQEAAVYRIAQEALGNVQRHANASRVEVLLRSGEGAVSLTVRDNGRGFDPENASKGHGLTNMAARARQNGGSAKVISEPGEGTEVLVEFLV